MLKQFEILVLDSDENRGKSISEYFSSMQIPTIYSSKFESIDDRYSAFIVDDNFPKINFSRFLIKCKRNNKIVIIMTKNFSQKYLDSLLNYGADDYIRVPFSNNDLSINLPKWDFKTENDLSLQGHYHGYNFTDCVP